MDSSQLLKGVLDLAVLAAVEEEDNYGYEIVTQLRTAGLEPIGEASVYGTLRRLHAAEHLETYAVASDSGPHRKYYRITSGGRQALADGAKTWRRFTETMNVLLHEEQR